MNIVINGQILFSDKFKYTGPSVYIHNLVQALAQHDQKNKYTLYLNRANLAKDFEDQFKTLCQNNPNFSFKIIENKLPWTQIGVALQLLKDNPDLYFTSVHSLPVIRNPKLKVICMIHGLEYKYTPSYKNWVTRHLQALPLWFTAVFSNKIIVPSNATKQELLAKDWGISDQKIKIIPEGCQKQYFKQDPMQVQKCRAKYNLSADYLIFISTIQPRKNVSATIEAFSEVVKDPKYTNIHLAIAGKNGWLYEDAVAAPQKYEVEDKVHFLGSVPFEDLPALLSGASAYVNFSLEEGFGLPVLEAMSCEVPCAVSNLAAFKEIAKDSLIFADPKSTESMKNAIIRVLDKDSTLQEKIAEAKTLSEVFTWEQTAKTTLSEFENVFKNS